MDEIEDKMKDKKVIIKMSVIGFFVLSIIGTLLHFTFEFSNNNLFIAIFSAINESVWEHLKIAIMPVFLWTIVELIIIKYRQDNLWSSILVKIITIILTIIIGFYLYQFIFKTHNVIFDIVIFYISILLGQILGFKELNSRKVKKEYEEISKYIVLIIFIIFVVFTFIPPNLSLFKDEITETFGVFKIKY